MMSLLKKQKTDILNFEKSNHLTKSNNYNEFDSSNDKISLNAENGELFCCRFSYDGRKLASCGKKKDVLIWVFPEKEEDIYYEVFSNHKLSVTSIRWTLDDRKLISTSADSCVGVLDTETGEIIRTLRGHEKVVNEADISINNLVSSVGDDGSLFLWDLRKKNHVNEIKTSYPLMTTVFNKTGMSFCFSGIDPTITSYDLRNIDKILWSSQGQVHTVTSLALNNDNSVILARSMDGIIKTYNSRDFLPLDIQRLNYGFYDCNTYEPEQHLIKACFSNDNSKIISGTESGTVLVWDFMTKKILTEYKNHLSIVTCVDFHPNADLIASSSLDGNIMLTPL